MQIVELSRIEHGHLRIDRAKALASFAATHMVPLTKLEIRRAMVDCPVVFAKNPETGQFYPAAMLGLEPQENLFWNGKDVELSYIPMNMRRAPFFLGGELGQAVLCVDIDSASIDPDGPETILAADGSDSAYMTEILEVLGQLAQQQQQTTDFVQTVADRGLLSRIEVDVVLDGGKRIRLEGIYGIDEPVLDRTLHQLEAADDKLACAAMILSLDRFRDLIRRKNDRLADEASWQIAG